MADRTVEEVKTRLDIYDVVKEYVQLKKAGTNYKGLCPFHNEKTPSFTVSQDKQIWHCFGCSEGGDVFSFIQKIEGLEFPETLRLLAERAGVKIERFDPRVVNKKTRLFDCLQTAADFYAAALHKSQEGQIARDYIQERKLDSLTVDQFKLGYAPDQWDALLTFLKKRGFVTQEMREAGLIIEGKGGRHFDRFRKRLMFPLSDHQGNVVGFTGRILSEDQQGGKYVNSPQTLLYDKSRMVYALDKAKQKIRTTGVAVLVEGQMDVLSAHQHGFTHVVAVSGTALTDHQVRLLSRYATTLAFCFDADSAGFEAARRGLDLVQQYDIAVKAVILPFGKDPDECIRKSPESFQKAVDAAVPVMEYLITAVLSHTDLKDIDQKKKAALKLLTEIRKIPNAMERTYYIDRLSDRLPARREDLHELFTRLKDARTFSKTATANTPHEDRPTALDSATEYILAVLITKPDMVEVVAKDVEPELFPQKQHRDLYKEMVLFYTANASHTETSFVDHLHESFVDLVRSLQILGDELTASKDFIEIQHELSIRLQLLTRAKIKKDLREIENHIRQLEGNPTKASSEELNRLMAESLRLNNALRRSM